MIRRHDIAIIGAGPNGLAAAIKLAKAGKHVIVVEGKATHGGSAGLYEFAPGFRAPVAAQYLSQLSAKVVSELELRLDKAEIETISLSETGDHFRWKQADASGEDGNTWATVYKRATKEAALLRPLMEARPPKLEELNRTDFGTLAKTGIGLLKSGRQGAREFLRIVGMNVFDHLEENLSNDLMKGALAFEATLGTHSGPRSPGTYLSLLHRLAQSGGKFLNTSSSDFMKALFEKARSEGVDFSFGDRVMEIVLEDGDAKGLTLASGKAIYASAIASSADPKTTLLKFIGAPKLDAMFADRVNKIRMNGHTAKLFLGLNTLPDFTGLDHIDLSNRLIIAPSANYVERAFNPAKYGECSPEPVMEIALPSLKDPSLAPDGKHTLTATVQYAPYDLKADWESGKAAFMETCLSTLGKFAPGILELTTVKELLSPKDLEVHCGMTGGHWHHGELTLDQMMMMRPTPETNQYKTPIKGLWLCGAGSHPGGGLTCQPGINAAKEILKSGGAS